MAKDLSAEDATEAELPFRQVAQDLPTPCWISDSEGSIVWVNAAWVAYTGMDVAAIGVSGLERLHDPAILPAVRERWSQVKGTGQPAEMIFPLKGRDGRLRPFLTRVVPLRDSDGVVNRWFGTNTDVSEQSNIEAALRESQHRLELATEAARLGIWDWNVVDNSFVYSARARAICGFPLDVDITYDDVVRATHPDDFPRTLAMAQNALDPAIKSVETYRYRVVRPDGDIRTVEAQGRAVFELMSNGAERATRYVGTLLDVTEVVALAETSKETEAVLNSLFDASELYIAVVEVTDDSFRYVIANRATLAFYKQPSDASGFDARDIGIPPEELKQWRATFLEVWESGKPRTMEYAFDGGQGPRWYLGTYTPLPAGQQGQPRISFVVIDISDRKRADERQALLMREVDHRAKNALAVAQAIVQLTRADNPETFRKAVQGRIGALARVHTLLADKRWTGADFSRLIQEELAPYVGEHSSRVVAEGPAFALSPAVAQTIGLVLHELATNAAKHGALSQSQGDVRITWSVDKRAGVTITWQETANSFAVDEARRGFGFTLLEQSIRKQLGGRWRIERTQGMFACIIELPHLAAMQAATPTSSLSDTRPQALIVEDETLITLALEEYLEELGFSIAATAARLSEAETAMAGRRYDIAVLDMNLAGQSTVNLARALRDAGTKVIFCTGYEAANLPPDLSTVTVLAKPVALDELRAALGLGTPS